MGAAKGGFGVLAGQILGLQIDQEDMRFGAAGHDAQAAFDQHLAHHQRIGGNLFLVQLEVLAHRLLERHRLAGDDMHQRTALQAGKNRRVDRFLVLGLHQDDAAARAAQRLVCGGGDDIGMRYRIRIDPGGDQAGVMRHIDHEDCADGFGHPGETGEVNLQRVGGSAGDDQLRLVFMRQGFHAVVVDFLFCVQAVGDDVEPLAGHVQFHAVRQMAAFRQAHAHDRVAGLQEGHEHRLVGLRTGVGLHIGGVVVGISAVDFQDTVDRQLLGDVDKFAAAVIAFAGIALGVLVGQLRTLRLHDSVADVVLGGDQFDMFFLAVVFALDGGPQFGIGAGNGLVGGKHG